MDLDRRYEHCNAFHVEYYDEHGRTVGAPEKVQPYPGQKLRDCLEYRLRQRGLVPSTVLFFVENSRTPLPENCDANFLSGQRIVAKEIMNCTGELGLVLDNRLPQLFAAQL
ncbi:unnamed protein product [Gongylonema pulchrum]|uniref:RBD domain-containing protein n=1 Tax=Gongylonema pulchrum TaxID=637853 RepID=A0A183CZH0_9BILA|nr:unnamed protein product [Gongylonema pulchrum]